MSRAFTLLDGGMGKHLHARGAPFRQPEWSALALMEAPEHVRGAHDDFIAAGADMIITNNYAVAPYHLGAERFDDRCEELVDLAGRIARNAADAADHPVRVAGSLPPMFGSYEPQLFDPEMAPVHLARIAAALAPYVDVFLAETQSLVAEARASAMAAAPFGTPVWVSFTLDDQLADGEAQLRSGEPIAAAVDLAVEVGAAALLFNCSQPEVMGPALAVARSGLPTSVEFGAYANAFEHDHDLDIDEEDYNANTIILEHRRDLDHGGYTAFVQQWVADGATIVGGCCGVMPPHIADLATLRPSSAITVLVHLRVENRHVHAPEGRSGRWGASDARLRSVIPGQIGRYEVHDVIGTGGFATVYRATDPNLDAPVAIKVLADNRAHDPEIRRRFRSEAVLLRRVQTEGNVPGIIEVFDIDETDDGRPYFVMGWADLGTLRERATGYSWSPDDVVPVVDALAETLSALHEAGVVHRDLTPSNVLLRSDRRAVHGGASRLVRDGERVVVGDLGLAKDLTAETSTLSLVAGTQRYMAPEQLDPSRTVDGRADVFGASVLVRDLLGGEHAPVTPAVAAALDAGHSPDPDARPTTIGAWREQLRAAFAESPTEATVAASAEATAPGGRAGRPALMLAAVAAVVAVVVGLWWFTAGDDAAAVVGPDPIVVGEPSRFDAADAADDIAWIDWTGARIESDTLVVTPVLPGELTFRLVADGATSVHTVRVVESPDGPSIVGPDRIEAGDSTTFEPELGPDVVAHHWRDAAGNRVDTEDLVVTPARSGEIVIALIATGADGVERGTQRRIQVS